MAPIFVQFKQCLGTATSRLHRFTLMLLTHTYGPYTKSSTALNQTKGRNFSAHRQAQAVTAYKYRWLLQCQKGESNYFWRGFLLVLFLVLLLHFRLHQLKFEHF